MVQFFQQVDLICKRHDGVGFVGEFDLEFFEFVAFPPRDVALCLLVLGQRLFGRIGLVVAVATKHELTLHY
jgi:hypothetical protein